MIERMDTPEFYAAIFMLALEEAKQRQWLFDVRAEVRSVIADAMYAVEQRSTQREKELRQALKDLCFACENGGTRYAPEWEIAAKLSGVLTICDICSGDGDIEAPRGSFTDRTRCPKCKGMGGLVSWW